VTLANNAIVIVQLKVGWGTPLHFWGWHKGD